MTATLTVPRQFDPTAERDRAKFERVFLLSGLALSPLPKLPVADHPMYPERDDTGHHVYRCAPSCRAHSVLAEPADAQAWQLYCAAFGIDPKEISDPTDRRAAFVEDIGHAVLDATADTGPVIGFGWRTFPRLHAP